VCPAAETAIVSAVIVAVAGRPAVTASDSVSRFHVYVPEETTISVVSDLPLPKSSRCVRARL